MNTKGQTALILILLTAAALIFFAITLNWGRIAQTKAMVTIAADQSSALLASDAASYGEQYKQEYLNNHNKTSSFGGQILAFLGLVLAVVCLILVIPSGGLSAFTWSFAQTLAVISASVAFVNLVLQLAVIQPGITRLWNNLMKNQPIQEQFYEGGIAAALQAAVTDQVKITDYFDLNTNGRYGVGSNGVPNDTISRFAFFYNDRAKMINYAVEKHIPQIAFFVNQLGEFLNGETCGQNAADHKSFPGVPLNPYCSTTNFPRMNCINVPTDPACQLKIPQPYGFQLTDSCTDTDPSGPYSPYCDPCCQPPIVQDLSYCGPNAPQPWNQCSNPSELHPTPWKWMRDPSCNLTLPSPDANCDPATAGFTANPDDPACVPSQCETQSNPYGAYYPYIYDPEYQEYTNGASFLDQFGRDQQAPLSGEPPFTSLTAQGSPSSSPYFGNDVYFPNGIYPFFWLMKDYSPEVDNIVSTSVQTSQIHWCVAPTAGNGVIDPRGYAPPNTTVFPSLTQLGTSLYQLSYTCSGSDCCVGNLADGFGVNGNPTDSSGKVIDDVGNPSYETSPFSNLVDGTGSDSWVPGDNQFCSTTWPYNGESAGYPDGSCEWDNTVTLQPPSNKTQETIDGIDDATHTMSDFAKYSASLINMGVGQLNATFKSWYPQAGEWFLPRCGTAEASALGPGECNAGINGRLLNFYDPNAAPPVDVFNTWNEKVVTPWLNNNYTNSGAWCVPPQHALTVSGKPTAEETYIASNTAPTTCDDKSTCTGGLCHDGTGCSAWGDLPHVIACLNYNSGVNPKASSIYNFQQCYNDLTASTCPATANVDCSSLSLGRSLLDPNVEPNPGWNGKCNNGDSSFIKWVSDSLTLAQKESPKFALRSAFLTDIYTRAKTMQTIFNEAHIALGNFFKTCTGCGDGSTCTANKCLDGSECGVNPTTTCQDGGPVAQLEHVSTTDADQVAALPNSVIYGWRDNPYPNGNRGYLHIVKVTAYSPGRMGAGKMPPSLDNDLLQPQLPWISTSSGLFTRTYELTDRDGYVYVSVRRWDEDHFSPITFPNKSPLWTFLFHSPNPSGLGTTATTTGIPAGCLASGPSLNMPFGLVPETISALNSVGMDPATRSALNNAFMLNDNPKGKLDPNYADYGADDTTCLSSANNLLAGGMESHACAEYIASSPSSNRNSFQSGHSNSGDSDYSIKFIPCPSGIPDDLD